MRVTEEMLELCRRHIDPPWKRRLRNLLHSYQGWVCGVFEAGEGVSFSPGSWVRGAWFGHFTSFGPRTIFSGPVVVGDLTMLSAEVHVVGQDHVSNDSAQPMRIGVPFAPRPVTVIEADCWIGARATIMEGVRIGRGSVVGAATVVTRSVPPYSVVVGVPGRILRVRFGPAQAREHDMLLYGRTFADPERDLDAGRLAT